MKKLFIVAIAFLAMQALPAGARTMTTEAESVVTPSIEFMQNAPVAPEISATATGREGEVRIVLVAASNPASIEYAVQEKVSGKFVNPASGYLENRAVWAKFEAWGGTSGVVVMTGSVPSPAFVASARSGSEAIKAGAAVTAAGKYRSSRDLTATIVETSTFFIVVILLLVILRNEFWIPAPKRRGKRK